MTAPTPPRPRVLFLSHLWPEPANSGGKLRVAALLDALRQVAETRLLVVDVTRTETRADDRLLSTKPRSSALNKLWRHVSATARGRSIVTSGLLTQRTQAQLRDEVGRFDPDVVILGDLCLAELLPLVRRCARPGSKVVIDTHNVESVLSAGLSRRETSRVQRVKHGFRARNNRMLERRYLPQADQTWAVSASDAGWYRDNLGLADARVVPNAVAFPPAVSTAKRPDVVLFVGTYDYFPNREAALELMDVADRLAARGIPHEVRIVGRLAPPEVAERASRSRTVRFVGEVPATAVHYAEAGIFAAPIRTGAGTKLKVIEALAAGCAVVGTDEAFEGLDPPADAVVRSGPGTEAFADALASALALGDGVLAVGRRGRAWAEGQVSQRAVEASVRQAVLDAAGQGPGWK